jgi:hypothetical protein
MNAPGNNICVLAIGELLADVITENFVDDLSSATTFRMFQDGSRARNFAPASPKESKLPPLKFKNLALSIVNSLRKNPTCTSTTFPN